MRWLASGERSSVSRRGKVFIVRSDPSGGGGRSEGERWLGDAGLHRANGGVEYRCGLGLAKAAHQAEGHDLTLLIGQGVDAGDQPASFGLIGEALVDQRSFVGLSEVGCYAAKGRGAASLGPPRGAQHVVGDAVQVGDRCYVDVGDAMAGPPGCHEGGSRQFLRFGRRTAVTQEEVVHTLGRITVNGRENPSPAGAQIL